MGRLTGVGRVVGASTNLIALISIEKETGMSDYIETGIPLNYRISSELLINIFIPNILYVLLISFSV